jgi:hypothetical protein
MKIIKTHDLGENTELRIIENTSRGNYTVNVYDLDVNQPLSFGYLCLSLESANKIFTKVLADGAGSICL